MAGDPQPHEVEEKPVREQFKKASIGGTQDDAAMADKAGEHTREVSSTDATSAQPNTAAGSASLPQGNASPPPHPQDDEAIPSTRHHSRKRSRDITTEEDALNHGQRKVSGERERDSIEELHTSDEANGVTAAGPDTPTAESEAGEAVASPKIKRSRVHSASTENESTITKPTKGSDDTVGGSASKIPPTSGFANASAASPFAALSGSKSPSADPTSSSATFASSGFGALAGSTTSGFGAISKTTGGFGSSGSFATSASKTGSSEDKLKEASTNTFGGALGQKSAFATAAPSTGGFGSGTSGFGKLGSGSGSGFGNLGGGIGGGLTSFASGKPSASLASATKPAKPFGAPKNDDEEGEDDDGEDDDGQKTSQLQDSEEKQDERFFVQDLETGEEGEDTIYTCRVKLYNYAADADGKKEWRERGLGALRLKVSKDDGPGAKPRARFLMRAEGSHRVVLNTPIKKEITYGTPTGDPPTGSYLHFMGTLGDGSGLEFLQIKLRAQFALELYDKIKELQALM